MPQINRIRVNNVKYNFGTQVYDDFMMRFNCRNTIYDLANGGGKSLLMLLLLQNVIPNCTLDDKQPIEKLFRAGSGNTVIHSLVEWKLDSCDIKDGYKFMTTGFCARKLRTSQESDTRLGDSTAQTLQTMSEETYSQSLSDKAPNRDSASVEYFNYCIFYREYGENDIKNLPLESNGEKITYNGLKSYLRDLEKKDFNVSVHIFERKGEYQNFISNYGLYESEWEIIRGINKTEGHVRTYFESNYKTSRKVVEDLLIEEIIQKAFHNRLAVEDDEGLMAQTLMDIKDKLVQLSKKNAQITNFDGQIAALNGFAEYIAGYEKLYGDKEQLKQNLYAMLLSCKAKLRDYRKKEQENRQHIIDLQEEWETEKKNVSAAEILQENSSLNSVQELIELSEKKERAYTKQLDELKEKVLFFEAADEYYEYQKYSDKAGQLQTAIANSTRDDKDMVGELSELAAQIKHINRIQEADLEKAIAADKAIADKAQEEYEDLLKAAAVLKEQLSEAENSAAYAKKHIEELEHKAAKQMEKAGLLVIENAEEQLIKEKSEYVELHSALEQKKSELEELHKAMVQTESAVYTSQAGQVLMQQQAEELKAEADTQESKRDRLEQLAAVYGQTTQNIETAILEQYYKRQTELLHMQEKISELEQFIQNAKKGIYMPSSAHYDKVWEYLVSQYGNEVHNGREWLEGLSQDVREKIVKRVPYIFYAFVVEGDFDRILNDRILSDFGRSAYVVPVVSAALAYEPYLDTNDMYQTYIYKNPDFVKNQTLCSAELETAQEELENISLRYKKLTDRKEIVWNDYLTVQSLKAELKVSAKEKLAAAYQELERISLEYEQNRKRAEQQKQQEQELTGSLHALEEDLDIRQRKCWHLQEIKEISDVLAKDYEVLKAGKADTEHFNQTLTEVNAKAEKTKQTIQQAKARINIGEEQFEKIRTNWISLYRQYDKLDKQEITSDKFENLTKENAEELRTQLESRFAGLKLALDSKNHDLTDKQALMTQYSLSMQKCQREIEKRHFSIDKVAEKLKAGGGYSKEEHESFNTQIRDIKIALEHLQDEIASQNALMNRIQGSIAHAVLRYEELYGEFKAFECNNVEQFITQHKQLAVKLSKDIKALEQSQKADDKAMREFLIIEKDLTRSVEKAGMEIPEELTEYPKELVDLSDYEAVLKAFDKLERLEFRKLEEFAKKKEGLVAVLENLDALELAAEVRLSVNVPENMEKTKELVKHLQETNSFIALEKERVAKGIEDMERIKENFENRCIQTCCNIKTELDRLPKMSAITMGKEVISMIGLQIPYIPEEQYAAKMAEYIDETVTVAESFKTAPDRLKYIRNRLSWKRLFSVIVTDMNAVRVNLYKRERIKDQSRYLKYEEAVGSTGQSQGIYIQFLIAIIHYISSIYAGAKEQAVLKKTIFIDNPFGAAKDIYIWEPIFALLKTNHVQLIVPARGATPAIIGRFDVNYILGQKLVDNRQQTVVVDYYSQTEVEELEYTRMDYKQAVFDFI